MLCSSYELQLLMVQSCDPFPDLGCLCPSLDQLFKGKSKVTKVEDCLKAFHSLSSDAEFMGNLQRKLCNASSDFAAWFLLNFMHIFAEEFSDKAQSDVACDKPRVISEEEKDVIYYIAGSVIKKLLKRMNDLLNRKKTRNADTKKVQEDISRLDRLLCLCDTVTSNKMLTESLNRGGLKFPKKTVFTIFYRAEQIFCSKVGELKSKIDIDKIVEECINDNETKEDFFEAIEEDCIETTSPILRACVTLYIKIRSHSHAKNIAEKYRKKTQTLKKKKGIRSELKEKDKK